MSLKVTHDGTLAGEVAERCCMCSKPTRYWHRTDVALCLDCAKVTKLAQLPTKKEWCAKESALLDAAESKMLVSLTPESWLRQQRKMLEVGSSID